MHGAPLVGGAPFATCRTLLRQRTARCIVVNSLLFTTSLFPYITASYITCVGVYILCIIQLCMHYILCLAMVRDYSYNNIRRKCPQTVNKIFILGHEITMSENRVVVQRWAVLYVHSTSIEKLSQCRIFENYYPALEVFNLCCNYLDTDYDGYNYVALLWDCGDSVGFRPIAWRDNHGHAWDMEDFVDG